MDRNFGFEIIISGLFLILITACSSPQPKQEDFVGMWKSEIGQSVFYLNIDGSCYGTVDHELLSSDVEKMRSFSQGKWMYRLEDDLGKKKMNIVIWDSSVKEINFLFLISGESRFGDKPPWYLFRYIGDPDDMNKYKLFKQNSIYE